MHQMAKNIKCHAANVLMTVNGVENRDIKLAAINFLLDTCILENSSL